MRDRETGMAASAPGPPEADLLNPTHSGTLAGSDTGWQKSRTFRCENRSLNSQRFKALVLISLAFRVVIDRRHDLASADFTAPAIFDHAFQLAFQSL